MKVYDVSADRKSGDKLFEITNQVVGIVEMDWKVDVVAVCSDAGPDAAKARRLLLRKRRDIISLDCYSHQVRISPSH